MTTDIITVLDGKPYIYDRVLGRLLGWTRPVCLRAKLQQKYGKSLRHVRRVAPGGTREEVATYLTLEQVLDFISNRKRTDESEITIRAAFDAWHAAHPGVERDTAPYLTPAPRAAKPGQPPARAISFEQACELEAALNEVSDAIYALRERHVALTAQVYRIAFGNDPVIIA